jgi:hypothetical protein
MTLSDKDIAEYQAMVKARFGVEISKADAFEEALSLINFVRLCYKKPTTEKNVIPKD